MHLPIKVPVSNILDLIHSNCKVLNKKELHIIIGHSILQSKILQSGSKHKVTSMKVKEYWT